jgi:hypothetical protein
MSLKPVNRRLNAGVSGPHGKAEWGLGGLDPGRQGHAAEALVNNRFSEPVKSVRDVNLAEFRV